MAKFGIGGASIDRETIAAHLRRAKPPVPREVPSRVKSMAQVTYLEAISQGLWEEMERDPNVFLIGEDIGVYGGAFKVTAGMLDHFGERRVVDTPIAESAIVGAAVGAGLMGLRPGGGTQLCGVMP